MIDDKPLLSMSSYETLTISCVSVGRELFCVGLFYILFTDVGALYQTSHIL